MIRILLTLILAIACLVLTGLGITAYLASTNAVMDQQTHQLVGIGLTAGVLAVLIGDDRS